MANENKKDFGKMLHDCKDMPKIQLVTNKATCERYGGNKMLLAPPIYYDRLMRKVPAGRLVTISQLRQHLANDSKADFTDPMTAGIFVNIAAWASFQRKTDITPYWRTLKSDGELNSKYPGGTEKQRELLEKEGHTVIKKGRKIIKLYVKDFEAALLNPNELL